MGRKGQAQKEHEAMRGQRPPGMPDLENMSAEEIEDYVQAQAQNAPTAFDVLHREAHVLEPQINADGSAIIAVLLATRGEKHLIPISARRRLQLGNALLAPSIEIAGADEMPRGTPAPEGP